jgi:tellurite resistance-related uncharacterized protein
MVYTATDFARDIQLAMAQQEPQQQRIATLAAVQRALCSAELLEPYAHQLQTHLEFHLLRTPEAAIKVFSMRPDHPLGPPHDHGGLWGCYATYSGELLMDFYTTIDPDGEHVVEKKHLRLPKGAWCFVEPEDIHRVWVREPTCVLTIYNGDLNSLVRRIYDLTNKRLIRDVSRWEERLRATGGSSYRL